MSLLIHSMSELRHLILPALEIAHARDVVEIGSEAGGMTAHLLAHAQKHSGWMVSVDPDPHPSAISILSGTPFGLLHRDSSLRAIPQIPCPDAYLMDGDHNYFTVANELYLIERQFSFANKPFLAFLHDVAWPWAYRDLYYNPRALPPEAVHPHTSGQGVTLDNPATVNGGFRGCGAWSCALEEGGERNGVLKSVEDFLSAHTEKIEFALIPAVFGLGVLYDASAPWSARLREFFAPWDHNPLLAALERNRLENYLRVIELQDAFVDSRERLVEV